MEFEEFYISGGFEGGVDFVGKFFVCVGSVEDLYEEVGEEGCGCFGVGDDEEGGVEDDFILRNVVFFILMENVVEEIMVFVVKIFINVFIY